MSAKPLDLPFECVIFNPTGVEQKPKLKELGIFIAGKPKLINDNDDLLMSLVFQSPDFKIFQGHLRCEDHTEIRNHSSGDEVNFKKRIVRQVNVNIDGSNIPEKLYIRVSDKFNGILKPNVTTEHIAKLESFSIGSLIDLHNFIPHFSSADVGESSVEISSKQLSAVLSHGKKKVRINFAVSKRNERNNEGTNEYCCEFEYSKISHIVVTPMMDKAKKRTMHFYFVLRCPVLLFAVYGRQSNGCHDQGTQNGNKEKDHTRMRVASTNYKNNLDPSFGSEVIGKSNVVSFSMLSLKNEKPKIGEIIEPWNLIESLNTMVDKSLYFGVIIPKPVQKKNSSVKIPFNIPFNVAYALSSVTNISYQLSDELDLNGTQKEFEQTIVEMADKNPGALEEVLFDVFRTLERGSVVRIFKFIQTKFEKYAGKKKKSTIYDINSNVRKIRKVVITPTRILCLPPDPFLMSRFMRKAEPDYCLRVSFRDDNLDFLTYTCRSQASTEYNVIRDVVQTVRKGVLIHDRLFEFLASSSSQLRQHGLIMYAIDTEQNSAAKLRGEIGDFTNITNVAKYIARMGMAFSQALANEQVPKEQVILDESDITFSTKCHPKSNEPYNFTDGVGKISIDLAKKCAQKLKYQLVPSAFQIRYAGAKGMVTLDPTLTGKQLVIRKSMNKFESASDSLEILKTSYPRELYLNKQFIMILDLFGVPHQVFLDLQTKAINELVNGFLNENCALNLIKTYTKLSTILPISDLEDSGVNVLQELFFRQAVEAITNKVMWEVKLKARIRLPFNAARSMLGVIDETGTLKSGEVFVQYSDPGDLAKRMVLQGDVMVTKSPSMVKGDVRKFKAVDVKALRHICDCIVFPAHESCSRPHPDEMAGSDLDGDEYAVVWYKPLIFNNNNVPAMDFPAEPAMEHKSTGLEQILSFYVDHIQKDAVGVIGNAHLARVDKLGLESERDKICKELAYKYAIALDAAKTGSYQSLSKEERPCRYPDYMGKISDKPTYLSHQVLGKLHRQACTFELSMHEDVTLGSNSPLNKLLLHPNREKYTEGAEEAYTTYQNYILSLVDQFGTDGEASLLTMAFLNSSKSVLKSSKEISDCQDIVEIIVHNVLEKMKDIFNVEFENSTADKYQIEEEKMAKASAWYEVTFNKRSCPQAVTALPWIVANHLASLAKRNKQNGMPDNAQTFTIAIDLLNAKMSPANESDSLENLIEKAEVMMNRWLESQTHLKLSCSEKVLQNVISEKMHDYYTQLKLSNNESLPSIGSLILAVFARIIAPLFDGSQSSEAELYHQVDKESLQLTALLSLNRFFRSQNVENMPSLGTVAPPIMPKKVKSFYYSLHKDQNTRMPREDTDASEDIDASRKLLHNMSGVDLLEADLDELGNGRYYLRINALGTKWAMNRLKGYIIDRDWTQKYELFGKLDERKHRSSKKCQSRK